MRIHSTSNRKRWKDKLKKIQQKMQYIMELQAKKAEHEAAEEAALKASIDALPAAPAVNQSSLPQLAQRVLTRYVL